MTTSMSSESIKWQQLLTAIRSDSDAIHFVFTDTSQSSLYASFLKSSNASHNLICTSILCHSPCHACIANTTVTPRANMEAALAVLRHLNVRSLVILFDGAASSLTWRFADFLSNTSLMHVHHVSIRVDLSRNATVHKLRLLTSDATRKCRYFITLCSENTTRAILN